MKIFCLNKQSTSIKVGGIDSETDTRICLPKTGIGPIPGESQGKVIIFPTAGAVSFPDSGQIIFP